MSNGRPVLKRAAGREQQQHLAAEQQRQDAAAGTARPTTSIPTSSWTSTTRTIGSSSTSTTTTSMTSATHGDVPPSDIDLREEPAYECTRLPHYRDRGRDRPDAGLRTRSNWHAARASSLIPGSSTLRRGELISLFHFDGNYWSTPMPLDEPILRAPGVTTFPLDSPWARPAPVLRDRDGLPGALRPRRRGALRRHGRRARRPRSLGLASNKDRSSGRRGSSACGWTPEVALFSDDFGGREKELGPYSSPCSALDPRRRRLCLGHTAHDRAARRRPRARSPGGTHGLEAGARDYDLGPTPPSRRSTRPSTPCSFFHSECVDIWGMAQDLPILISVDDHVVQVPPPP